MTLRAMLAVANAPGRATHARQIKGKNSDKGSEKSFRSDYRKFQPSTETIK